jgi:hypothetical protein
MALHPKLLDTPTDSAQTSIHLASSIGQWRMVRWLIVAEELSRLAEVIHLESNRPTVVYDPSNYDKVITEVNSTAHKDTTFETRYDQNVAQKTIFYFQNCRLRSPL